MVFLGCAFSSHASAQTGDSAVVRFPEASVFAGSPKGRLQAGGDLRTRRFETPQQGFKVSARTERLEGGIALQLAGVL